MSRSGLVSELVAQLNSQAVRYALFAEMFFDDGVARFHQSVGTITASEPGGGTRDWQGVGDLGSVGPIRENTDLKSQEVELTLSGLNSTMVNEAVTNACAGRVIKLFIGAFGEDDKLTPNGTISFLWRGRMSKMRPAYGEAQSSISVLCESEAVTLLRSRFGYFTHDLQQRRFAGDLGFEFVAQLPFVKVQWSGKSVTTQNTYSPTPVTPPKPRIPFH